MKWKHVYSCPSPEAHIIKGKLESENIPVQLKEETVARLYAIAVDGIGNSKILVPEEYEEEARRIIEEDLSEE